MITYESLKELAQALSKVTGYRYVAFCESNTNDLVIKLSNYKMRWFLSKLTPPGFWFHESDCQILKLRDFPQLNWSKCQFDCKEEENDHREES